jgi:hypothetical protein
VWFVDEFGDGWWVLGVGLQSDLPEQTLLVQVFDRLHDLALHMFTLRYQVSEEKTHPLI